MAASTFLAPSLAPPLCNVFSCDSFLPYIGCGVQLREKAVVWWWASGRWRMQRSGSDLRLRSTVLDAWCDWRSVSRTWVVGVTTKCCRRQQRKLPEFVVVDEVAGQYEESFEDVDKYLLDFFTFKAVKTVLAQLHEMNPGQYTWFYSFLVNNKPQDGKRFLRVLVKERQELGERVMITRLHLFNKWVKKYNHGNMHKYISNENLELLRERLIQTVKFTSEGDELVT